jgi:hypothetical protein
VPVVPIEHRVVVEDARLLELNEKRAKEERLAGITTEAKKPK